MPFAALAVAWSGSLPASAAPPWPAVALTEPDDPRPVGLGDLDGDGDLEALLSARPDRLVRSDPSVGVTELVAAVPGVGVPAWVDLSGDGRPDLLFEDHVRVADAEGWWSTALALDPWVARAPPLAVDLDSDGLPEVLRVTSDGVWAAGNDGGGRFRPFVQVLALPVGGAVVLWTAADLDGDGDLDLLRYDGPLTWMRNDGWSFADPAPVSRASANAPLLSDWDGDGDLDVIGQTVLGLPNGTWVAANQGDGTFGAPSSLGPALDAPLGAADLDGDGRPDVLYRAAAGVTLALQGEDGRLGAALPIVAGRGRPTAALPADADGDGDLDLFLTDPSGHAFVRNDGAAGFSVTPLSGAAPCPSAPGVFVPLGPTLPLPRRGGPPSLALPACGLLLQNDGAGHFRIDGVDSDLARTVLVDVDQDGLDDWVGIADDRLVWQRNDGVGPAPAAPLEVLSDSLLFLAVGDAEGDGDADVLVTSVERSDTGASDGVNVARWLLLPEREVVPGWRFPASWGAASPVTADLDGDGDADAAVWDLGGLARVCENDGTGALAPRTALEGRATGAVDLDADGRVDLFGIGLGGDSVLWRSTGSFGFGPPERLGPPAPTLPLAGDADGDGAPEIWVAIDGATVARGWAGDGLGPEVPLTQGTGELALDLDGDGDLDLTGGGLVWWNPTLAPTSPPATDTGEGPADPPPVHSGPAPEPPAAAPRPPPSRGCGCASGAGPHVLLWPALLAATLRRTRRRAPGPGATIGDRPPAGCGLADGRDGPPDRW